MTQKKKASAPYSALSGIHRAVPIILFAFAVFTMFCFFTKDIAGALGDVISTLFLGLFSYGAYAIPLLLAVHAVFYPSDIAEKRVLSRVIFSLIAIVFISALSYSITYWNEGFTFNAVEFFKNGQNTVGGGFIGGVVGFAIIQIVGRVGLVIIAASILAIYVSYFFSGGQRGIATVFYLIFHAILSILSFFEKAIKGAHRKAKKSKADKVKRNADLKNLELTDDEYFDVDNGIKKLSVSALGIKMTRADSDVNAGTTLHDKVFHKSAVSEEEARRMDMRDKQEEFFYSVLNNDDDNVVNAFSHTNDTSFVYSDITDAKEEPKAAEPTPVKQKDESADSIFTGTFDPFSIAMSEKLASKPSSRSLLDEKENKAKIREDVRELTPEEIEREKRILEFERRKAAIVNANRPTPVNNDGEFKGTPKNVDFHERKDESMKETPKETETSSFVFDKSERAFEAPKAEPANYTSISFGQESESFSSVVNKPVFTSPETIYSSTPKKESYTESAPNRNTYYKPYQEPVNESVPTSTPYVEEDATHIFSKKDESSYTVYSSKDNYKASAFEEPSNTDYRKRTPFDMDHSDEGEIFSFSTSKSYKEPEVKTYEEPVVKPSFDVYDNERKASAPESSYSYKTASVSEPEIKEYVPEFKPYQAASDEDISLNDVNVIQLDEKEPETPSTIKIERERITDETPDVYDYSDDEEELDENVEMPPEEEEDSFETEEIPPEEQNPVVHSYKDMFTALREEEDSDEEETDEADYEEPEYEEENFDEEDDEIPPFEHNRIKPEIKLEKPKKTEEKAEKKKPDFSNYKKPPIELLGLDPAVEDDTSEINENTKTLIDTLASFNVTASIKGVDRGPRITRYEVVPARGVKVNSITNLFNDIKLNLGKEGVRMEAPIPGKSAIGFEIPNVKPKTVRLRELIDGEEFSSAKASDTFVAIGKDVSGNPVYGDICKYPHALICGATGMGKSVCINSILVSMLYRAHPKDVKLIMIDPKKVEFKMYSGIPHLLIPVITESKQAAGALMWAVEEMERRYELIETHCVRNIEAYNEKVAFNPSMGEALPKIIIVIDELADLMMQVRDPVEDLIMRIAQKARAAGIHLIIGTQRPSTNIITGSIKANIPSRFSCKVTSQVDSRTIFDTKGAEELLNKGDMLYWPVDRSSPLRVQGAFVSDKEVEDVMQFLKDQVTDNVYDDEIFTEINKAAQKCGNKKSGGAVDDEDDTDGDECGYYNDQQFLDAVELAIRSGKVSTSLLQRKLSIGYGKAAKYIDAMEDIGIVSEPKGQKPRDVLVSLDEWHEKLSRVDY